jgi:hypothetical protein
LIIELEQQFNHPACLSEFHNFDASGQVVVSLDLWFNLKQYQQAQRQRSRLFDSSLSLRDVAITGIFFS